MMLGWSATDQMDIMEDRLADGVRCLSVCAASLPHGVLQRKNEKEL